MILSVTISPAFEYVETITQWFWPTVILDNGALVTFQQQQIRVSRSYTHGRGISDQQMKKIIKPKVSTRTPRSMGRMLRKS